MKILKIEETDSTNIWLKENEKVLESPLFVYCVTQTAGRGQRGNTWESEPGKNITGSLLFHPLSLRAENQFLISEAVALGVVELLGKYGIQAKIKWPNDIYVDNEKICGILVENVITGRDITRSIAGVGLNVNQDTFISDAPNPVSMTQITGLTYPIDRVTEDLVSTIESNLKGIITPEELHEKFMEKLWRNDGNFYPFFDRKSDEPIKAKIQAVRPDGTLMLITDKNEVRSYVFKEIEFKTDIKSLKTVRRGR